jgi:hypothetical protein
MFLASKKRHIAPWPQLKCQMRKFLITLAILAGCFAAVSAIWIFGGRQVSLFIDRYSTIGTASQRINLISYEGSGTGGILHVNGLALSLNDTHGPSPNIGSTKDDQLALAAGGTVFAFGPPRSEAENLVASPSAGDDASVTIQHSILSWPTLFDFNFMTGQSPSWKRHVYYALRWKKPSGATLEMLWRYEQYFYPAHGWGSGFMTRKSSTGLVKVEIRPHTDK